jgi:hypothetical protein
MRIGRRDSTLNERIEALDEKYIRAQALSKTATEVIPRTWAMLDADELAFVDGELEHCITDRRYFMENYYVIRDERGRLKTLYPWWDHQELVYEAVEEEWAKKGCCRLIILKPRQAGSTTWNGALITAATIFVPNTFSLLMAQDSEVSGEIYQRVMDAFHGLPFWMQPETMSRQQGTRVIFQRDDQQDRVTDPGLGSTLMISNAQRSTGVAIGRTIKNILGSEISRWPEASVWTADIKPSLNAPDMLGIMESTAFGRHGLYYNMWRAAEAGKSIWRALFIPVYRVRKYFIPVLRSDNFRLTPDERGLRENVLKAENFHIPLGFFKWRRAEIVEAINSTGSDETHFESYPVTSQEAFVNSGFCAFPRHELKRQLRVNACDPIAIGEIEYVGMDLPPVLHLHTPRPSELVEKPTKFNRLWVWEEPLPPSSSVEYYLSGDVGGGEEGNDFSAISVYRLGYGPTPDVQVATWHGHMNPSHLARAVAALGQWYNECEVAVEYAQSGITTCNELQWTLDYPNLYRWKQLDKISNTATVHTHWMTTERTRSDAINRMNEKLLDQSIIIHNRHTLEEMLDFGTEDGGGKAQGLNNNDDMVMSDLINVGAASQSGKHREIAEAMGMGTGVASSTAAGLMPAGPCAYAVFDQYSRQVEQVASEQSGLDLIARMEEKYKVKLDWRVVPVRVMKANTPWSELHDGQGAARALYEQGMKDTHVTPDIVQVYRDLLNHDRHSGGSGSGGGPSVLVDGEDF